MRRIRNFTISKESLREMLGADRYNPCLEITFQDRSGKHTHKLGAGYGDEIDVYREHGQTFVLTRNQRLGYVGIEVFKGPDKTGDLFLDSGQVSETLGRDDLAPFTVIRRLLNYVVG